VRPTGPKRKSNGDTTVYYSCNRNGCYYSKATEPRRKRDLKGTGSKKIPCTCPASMTVSIKQSGYHVNYVSTHDGNKHHLGHLNLTKLDRKQLAGIVFSVSKRFYTVKYMINTEYNIFLRSDIKYLCSLLNL
jgi:hypothetical protein